MWTNTISAPEAAKNKRAVEGLRRVTWAQPLLRRLEHSGGMLSNNAPLLFEVRFAYELHQAGCVAEYEYAAGVGQSSVDFKIPGGKDWLLELVSIRESQAVQRATTTEGPLQRLTLTSDSPDSRQSEEGEMLLAQQKIGEKVLSGGQVIKFPVPSAGTINAILTDMRGYLGMPVADRMDYRQIAYGASGVPEYAVHFWRGSPIKGLFEEDNPLPAARVIRERIHFLGFVAEHTYDDKEIISLSYYLPNPHLISDQQQARDALASFCFRPVQPAGKTGLE